MPVDRRESEDKLPSGQDVAISRRGLLRGAGAAMGGAAILAAETLTPQRADAGNMTQKAAGYQPTPKDGKRCDGCSLFQPPSACKLVAGPIDPAGWCRFWVKKA
ncbi:MAG TPA: twin-arginine translocation signal domain-containing protein [Rhizomicrobium sp.]|jgi:hypothetical protein|nr:twin-arginine translocation signal domain-containing protein [Rhizomicrobium sp.]